MNGDIELDGRKYRLSLPPAAEADADRLRIDDQPCSADIRCIQPNVLSLLMDGKSYRILFDPRSGDPAIVLGERRISYRMTDPRALRSGTNAGAEDTGIRPILASMPGRIVRLLVQPGDRVEAQQGLIVVEAMKMQNELKAPRAGGILRIPVEVGATVQAGDLLLVLE